MALPPPNWYRPASSYLHGRAGDTDMSRVLVIAEAAICSWTELCPSFVLTPYDELSPHPHHISGDRDLENNSAATAYSTPTEPWCYWYCLWWCCAFFTGWNCSFDSHNVVHKENTFLQTALHLRYILTLLSCSPPPSILQLTRTSSKVTPHTDL